MMPRPTPPGGSTFSNAGCSSAGSRAERPPSTRCRRMASALARIDARAPARRHRRRPLCPQRRRWPHGAVRSRRGRQSGDALERCARASLRHALVRHHGPPRGDRAPARSMRCMRGEGRAALSRHLDPERDLLFAVRRRSAISPTPRRNVLNRVPLDASTGLPVGDPVPLVHHRVIGGLDGAVVDADGLIWNARWGGGCVDVYDPAGQHLRTLARARACNRVVPPSSARICRSCWSPRPGRAWTRPRAPPIPTMAAPSCWTPARAAGPSRM